MKTSTKLKIKVEQSKDYKIFPANGVWTGIGPRGDFKLDFFVESGGTPEYVVHEISPEGVLGPEIERKPSEDEGFKTITREMIVGVLLTREQATSLANLILQKCDEFDKVMRETRNKEQ